MKYLLHCIVILSLATSINAQAQKVKPKGVSEKGGSINYAKHQGKAFLKTGLIMEGEFKLNTPKKEIPYFTVQERRFPDVEKIDITMIKELLLAGSEKGVVDRKDSTRFVWFDAYDDLYRQVRNGDIKVYDNSRVINEKYKFIPSYIMIAEKEGLNSRIISELKDLEEYMKDRPYFLESAKATGKYESRDLRVIIYLIDLYNDKDPMKVLKWKDVEVVLKDGGSLSGKGYIQPVDLRNEFTKESDAFLHFHDGKEFRLLTQEEVRWVYMDGQKYEPGFYSVTSKHVFGTKWRYENQDYIVSQKLTNTNSYFFTSKYKNGEDMVILKEVSGSYKRATNEPALRARYKMEQVNK